MCAGGYRRGRVLRQRLIVRCLPAVLRIRVDGLCGALRQLSNTFRSRGGRRFDHARLAHDRLLDHRFDDLDRFHFDYLRGYDRRESMLTAWAGHIHQLLLIDSQLDRCRAFRAFNAYSTIHCSSLAKNSGDKNIMAGLSDWFKHVA